MTHLIAARLLAELAKQPSVGEVFFPLAATLMRAALMLDVKQARVDKHFMRFGAAPGFLEFVAGVTWHTLDADIERTIAACDPADHELIELLQTARNQIRTRTTV